MKASTSEVDIKIWFQALRVKHWVKNFFVLVPFLLGPKFGINEFLLKSLAGVLLFSLMSSAVYLFNDIIDIEYDKKHPEKRLRPIASGKISITVAATVSFLLVVLSLSLGYLSDFRFFLILTAYAGNNILYSFYVKEKTVLDVISIAIGFVLRIYAGGFIADTFISNWLVACVFSVSMVFGFGKRRAEYQDYKQESSKSRKVQEFYSAEKLNILLGISSSVTIVTYMLYTIAPEILKLHGTDKLIFTTPIVIYAIYRYMIKVQEEKQGSPVDLLLGDPAFLLSGLLWLVSILILIQF